MDDMKEKYFVEFNIEGILEIDEDRRDIVIDKINKLVSKVLERENALHLNINISLVSERNLMFAMANNMDIGDDN
jgi:hypothetical protein